MKNKIFLTIVFEQKNGEGKLKFIEGIRYYESLVPDKNNYLLVDLSNFYFGKSFEFDSEIKKLGVTYFKPRNIFELYNFTKKKNIYAFGLDNCNYKLLYIFIITNLLKIKLIFINYFGFFPQSDYNRELEKLTAFFKYSYHRFNYFFFRTLSFLRITSRIHTCFEASESRINNIKQSFSYKVDKKLNLKIFSYMENIFRINSIYYDKFQFNEIKNENKYIIFVDNGFDHPDRVNNDVKVTEKFRNNYYKNLYSFLLNLKKIYNLDLLYCKHPKAYYPQNAYFELIKKNFIKSSESTLNLIKKSDIVIFTETSLMNEIILLKKKIILLNSEYIGSYSKSKLKSIKNEIDLFSITLENFKDFNKKYLDGEMLKKIKHYEEFTKKNLCYEKKIKSSNQIKKNLI